MGKLKVFSGNEVCRILEQHGFIEIRHRGSHIVMQKKLDNSTITVPVPNHPELYKGTLRSIIRQSGILKKEFET